MEAYLSGDLVVHRSKAMLLLAMNNVFASMYSRRQITPDANIAMRKVKCISSISNFYGGLNHGRVTVEVAQRYGPHTYPLKRPSYPPPFF
jgi:hypothetical protein